MIALSGDVGIGSDEVKEVSFGCCTTLKGLRDRLRPRPLRGDIALAKGVKELFVLLLLPALLGFLLCIESGADLDGEPGVCTGVLSNDASLPLDCRGLDFIAWILSSLRALTASLAPLVALIGDVNLAGCSFVVSFLSAIPRRCCSDRSIALRKDSFSIVLSSPATWTLAFCLAGSSLSYSKKRRNSAHLMARGLFFTWSKVTPFRGLSSSLPAAWRSISDLTKSSPFSDSTNFDAEGDEMVMQMSRSRACAGALLRSA